MISKNQNGAAIGFYFAAFTFNGDNGFRLDGGVGVDSMFGSALSEAKDVNLDGIDDIIIGSSIGFVGSVLAAGKSYVVFGNDEGVSHPLNISELNGSNGFSILGADVNGYLGTSVSGIGDFNDDGIGDVMMSAPRADVGGENETGKSFIIFGNEQAIFVNGFD